LDKLKSTNAKVVIITDGKHGVYAYDGMKYYRCPEFPATVVSTLGAGDALSSTFTASLMYTNWDVEKSLKLASVNAASIVSHFGAQEGFLSFEEMEERLLATPDFKVQIL
jgi:sugar/nucleoside kinase (ribokinase family)